MNTRLLAFAVLLLGAAHAAPNSIAIELPLEPPHLDPTQSPAEAIRVITNGNVYEGLARIDQDGKVQPLLAQSWTISSDGLHYAFKLQPNVKFHDGSSFDCSNVQFSLNRTQDASSVNALRPVFANIAKIDCPSPLEAGITLKTPDGGLIKHLAWPEASILSPATAAGDAQHPVGTGPFEFASWQRGYQVTLNRNDRYWGAKPALASASFRFFKDDLAVGNALTGGQIDVATSLDSQQDLARFHNDPRFVVLDGTFPIKVLLALNNAAKPFDDVRVRRALAYAIDRPSILTALELGGTVIGSHMAPSDPDYVDLSKQYPYDPGKARALLAQAGVAPGTHITITIPAIFYGTQGGQLIAAYLSQVGLVAGIKQDEWAQWLDQVFGKADYQTTVIAHTEPDDLDIYARPHYYFNYHSTAYNALYQRYTQATDAAQRHQLSAQLQQQLADDEPNVFLFSFARHVVIRKGLNGVWHSQPIAEFPLAGISITP